MRLTRRLRKEVTYRLQRWGLRQAQNGSHAKVERLRKILHGFAKTAFPLRERLKQNMKLAGVYQPHLIDAYFERAIDQMMMLAHSARAGFAQSGSAEKFRFDESFTRLEQAYARGKGVVTIAPHISGYPLYPAVVSQRIPCAIYMRRNKDPRKMQLNTEIARAGDSELIYPPENATKARRLQVAIDILRQGKMFFITPDTPRKPHEGVPVTIYGRTAIFPIGVFIMSLRTGAPVVPALWHFQDGQYHIHYDEPIELMRGGDLRDKAAAATKKWAKSVDEYLYRYPEMWWNWLDKRWTRIIRNDFYRDQLPQ